MISFKFILSVLLLLPLYGFTSTLPETIPQIEEYVELQPFLNSSFEEANQEIGCQPLLIDVPQELTSEIFSLFNRSPNFPKICEVTSQWAEEFISLNRGGPWENTNYRFGIFDKSKPTHKKSRLIKGINCKISREYCNWIREEYSEQLAAIPELESLFDKLMTVEEICHAAIVKKVKEIAQTYPNIERIFYSEKGQERIPLSIRITRYDNTGHFCLPLHHDISVLSLILLSDDQPKKECLLVASPKNFALNKLKRPIKAHPINSSQVSSVLIAGAMMPSLDIPIQPSPHAVLPHDRNARYVIVICCHIPNLCTSNWNTVLNDMRSLPDGFKKKWGL